MTISGRKDLSSDEINKMVDDAKQFEAEDKKRREEIELRNNADNAVYSAEKLVNDKETADKIDAEDKDKITKSAAELKEVLSKEDAKSEDIKSKMDALQEVVISATTKMYQKIQAEKQAAESAKAGCDGSCGNADCGGSTKKDGDDKVVDADYEVKKDSENQK